MVFRDTLRPDTFLLKISQVDLLVLNEPAILVLQGVAILVHFLYGQCLSIRPLRSTQVADVLVLVELLVKSCRLRHTIFLVGLRWIESPVIHVLGEVIVLALPELKLLLGYGTHGHLTTVPAHI